MYYVTQFEADPTKSFTQTAFANIKALQTQQVNFEIRPLNFVLNWQNRPSWFSDDNRDYFTKTTPVQDPIALVHLQISDLLKVPYTSRTHAIGLTAIESSQIARWVCQGLNESYRGMIVPSEHCKTALENSGLTIPVRVVPHALPDMWRQSYPPLPEKDPNVYVFGFVGNWNSRKNPKALLDAYLKAFPETSENTALLIKTYNAGDIQGYIRQSTGQDRPDIWIYDEAWTEQQMLWAFSMIDCYVSPHRGEGFGLTLAQNAALGKPSIFTNYSAPTEWLGEGHYKLPFSLEKVSETLNGSQDHKFERLQDASIEWADIAVSDVAYALQRVAEERPQSGFSEDSLAEFRSKLSWESVGEVFTASIEDIIDRKLEYLP